MSVKLRAFISGAALLMYLAVFNYYIYMLHFGMLPQYQYKLLYNYMTAGMFVFSFVDRLYITEGTFHKQMNLCCFLAVVCNYTLIILTHHNCINDAVQAFSYFNGLIFVTHAMILYFGGRHGLFNE